jgi:hypothetical protein
LIDSFNHSIIQKKSISDVATHEGSESPHPVDWNFALATEEDPKSCLYSCEYEANTKVLAPLDTTQWMSLGALNRLISILESWLDPESQYSLLQHVAFKASC